jgi:tight adherence protein B
VKLAAALFVGCATTVATLAVAGVGPRFLLGPPARLCIGILRRQQALAEAAGWPWLGAARLSLTQALAGVAAAWLAWALTGLAVLTAVAAVMVAAGVRALIVGKAGRRRAARQDAAVEAVRTLRQLLETGAVGVQQALAVLAEKGPPELRPHFRLVVVGGSSASQRQAWAEACERLGEPLFDMLAAAVLVQRPGGGELAPLFIRLEESVAAVHEVTREAEALGVQARSAAALILGLPLVFLGLLSMLRSPYLDAYRGLPGQAFLALMLLVMGVTYVLILRWLRLPEQPRLRISNARG